MNNSTLSRTALFGVVAAVLGLTAACGHSTDDDMNAELDRVFDQALLVERELDSHQVAAAPLVVPTSIDAIELAHGTAMQSHMDVLDHMLGDMTTYCRNRQSQELGATHDMQASMTTMRTEVERHVAAPRTDLSSTRAEEAVHQRESRLSLTRLREAGNAMRPEAGFYRCEHGNH